MTLKNISNPGGGKLPDARIITLGMADLERIVALEKATWTPSMQAGRAIIAERIELNHGMIGLESNGQLLGMVASRFAVFDPLNRSGFPDDHRTFSNQPNEAMHNAAFVYTLHALPEARGYGVPQQLMLAGRDFVLENSCRYVVGDARCASYNGTTDVRSDHVKHNPEFQMVVDQAVASGILPPLKQLIRDPVLRFYYRVLMCTFSWIIPGYFADDQASGGHGVIFYNVYEQETM